MSVLVIFNPISGAGRARILADRVAIAGRERGIEMDLVATEPGFRADRWLRGHLKDRDALVVVGGDGAVRLVASEASRAGIPLLHYPAGNENLFAREFGMLPDPDFVAETLLSSSIRKVDLVRAEVDGRDDETVVLMGSMGLDAEVVHDLSSTREGSVNNASYVLPMIRQWLRYKPPRISVTVDGKAVAEDVPGMVFVANSRQYAARLDPARHARMDDGLIDLVMLPCRTKLGLLLWLAKVRLGRHLKASKSVYATGRRIELETPESTLWQVDGDPPREPLGVRRIAFEVVPEALSVLVPDGQRGSSGPRTP